MFILRFHHDRRPGAAVPRFGRIAVAPVAAAVGAADHRYPGGASGAQQRHLGQEEFTRLVRYAYDNGVRFFEKLAYTADPNELAKLVAEADEAKLHRALKAAALMAKLGLIPKSEEAINNQVKEIMEWSDADLDEMEYRLIVREKCSFDSPAPKSGTKKKSTSRKPKKKKTKVILLAPKRKNKRTERK